MTTPEKYAMHCVRCKIFPRDPAGGEHCCEPCRNNPNPYAMHSPDCDTRMRAMIARGQRALSDNCTLSEYVAENLPKAFGKFYQEALDREIPPAGEWKPRGILGELKRDDE